MLRTLKDLFNAALPPQAGAAASEHTLELATAVLLVEVMRASTEIGDAERRAVLAALHDKFSLTADESARLLQLAQQLQPNLVLMDIATSASRWRRSCA